MDDNLIFLLTWSQIPGVGYKSLSELISSHPELSDLNIANRILDRSVDTPAFKEIKEKTENYLNNQSWNDVFILSVLENSIPRLMQEIEHPPAVLWGRGNKSLMSKTGIAIVGTRAATEWGKQVAFQLAKKIDYLGYTVVSGLASGIDTAAHEGSLNSNGNTIAILPSGFDHITPAHNKDLAEKIANKGLLLSEYIPYTKPKKDQYIARDRLQTALSEIVIVVETELSSGTMHTAKFATEQDKDLVVVERKNKSDQMNGSTKLLQEGAYSLQEKNIDEIEDFISHLLKIR